MLNSIWADNTNLPAFPALDDDLKTDVLIIGGGMAGLLCAYMLDREGMDYILVEADEICRGISRNTTAKITSQHGLIYHRLLREFGPDIARLYWEANEKALAQFRAMAQPMDCGFETKDNFIYSVDRPDKLEKELNALEKLRIPGDFVEEMPIPVPAAGAVRFRNQAQFDPVKFLAHITKELNIYEHTPVRSFDGQTVNTAGGRIRASAVITATHFPIFNKHGGYFLKLYQDRSYVLAMENGPDLGGMYLDESNEGFSFRNHGNALLIGHGGHRTGKKSRGWEALKALVGKYYPGGRVTHHWAAQDCMTLDGIPYIGQYAGRTPGMYVATGFNKWGMTSAMVSALVLRDQILGRENPYAAVFSPQRRTLRPQLFVNTLEAAANLLTPTKPRCPHMGCALKWNAYERTWDCPCHGSRFSEEGKLRDGPATGDHKGIE